MKRRVGLIGVLVVVSVLAFGALARAESWHSAQPPPPEGQSGVGVPVGLGHIGEISFWAPNRGLLITAGSEAIPAGLYYYDGVSWRELSTVCGGSEGRIAWAGENDFWTISDQQVGQQLGSGEGNLQASERNLSLCHFENGRVVASYAEPIGVPGSYQHMYAAACSGPQNCWFAGEALSAGANTGAFHLHWDGQTMTPVPSLETPEPRLEDPAHTVRSMVFYKGHFYESVQIQAGDRIATGESASQPFLIHRISEGSSDPFVSLIIEGLPAEAFNYGGGEPSQLSAFQFSGDANELWALAGPDAGSAKTKVTALLLNSKGQFQQVALSDPSGELAGEGVGGVAGEPGSEDAWVSIDQHTETNSVKSLAQVVRIRAEFKITGSEYDGALEPVEKLPEAGEELAHKGEAGAIACPAHGDCWVATSQGWLFHLGGSYPQDEDPYFQSLITYRPPDASIPFVAPENFPEDDSGANPPAIPPPALTVSSTKQATKARVALFSHVKVKLTSATTLTLSFTLATKSYVKLVAMRNKRRVAGTRRDVLSRGRHTLELHLRRNAWPTKLDLQVKAIGVVPLVSTGSKGRELSGGEPNAVATSRHVGTR